jgi:hypothetical protein
MGLVPAANRVIWRSETTPRDQAVAPKAARTALAAAAATWKGIVPVAMVVASIGTRARIAAPVTRTANTIAHLAARQIGAATAIAIRTVTSITTPAFVPTASSVASNNANSVSIAAARTTTAAVAPRRAAVAAHSAVAARRAIKTTTSIPVRRWLRPRIRITRCVVLATSCSRIRRRSARIECESHARGRPLNVKQQLARRRNPPTELAHCSGGKAEGGRGKRFPAFTLCFCNLNSRSGGMLSRSADMPTLAKKFARFA